MGNNYEKNFSKAQRKILVIGVEKSGKTCFIDCLNGKPFIEGKYTETNDIDIIDAKKEKIQLQFYDFAGCERKRIFWRHHYIGAQGIVFVIDGNDLELFKSASEQLQILFKERNLIQVPVCIFINKSDISLQADIKSAIDKLVSEHSTAGTESYRKLKVVIGSNKLKEGHQQVKEWLEKVMVSI